MQRQGLHLTYLHFRNSALDPRRGFLGEPDLVGFVPSEHLSCDLFLKTAEVFFHGLMQIVIVEPETQQNAT
jgi:hypothetical protein